MATLVLTRTVLHDALHVCLFLSFSFFLQHFFATGIVGTDDDAQARHGEIFGSIDKGFSLTRIGQKRHRSHLYLVVNFANTYFNYLPGNRSV